MFIPVAIVFIAVISIILSLWSVKDMKKGLKTHETKKELQKGRVIFHASHHSSTSSS